MVKKPLYLLPILIGMSFPSITLILISANYDISVQAFIPMTIGTSILFGLELIARDRGNSFVWSIISKSTHEKIVFASCLILFWAISALPIYLHINMWWIILISLLLGYAVAALFFKFFASQRMKRSFSKQKNIFM
jgi:hypothetical protein